MKKKGTPKLQRNRVMRSTLGDVPITLRSTYSIARLTSTTTRPTAKYARRKNRTHSIAMIPAQPTGLLRGLLIRIGVAAP